MADADPRDSHPALIGYLVGHCRLTSGLDEPGCSCPTDGACEARGIPGHAFALVHWTRPPRRPEAVPVTRFPGRRRGQG